MPNQLFQRVVLLACSIFLVTDITAQPRNPIKPEESPKLHAIPDSLKSAPAVFILEERRIEMLRGDEGYEQYYTTHHIIRLNDDKGVEYFNTFNIPVVPGTELYKFKARTILSGGKVIDVGRDKLKKIKSERGIPEYLLAMEGVEPGAEVEVLYTQKLPGTAASQEVFQYPVPVMQAVFQMIVPDHMRYEAKGYNGFPTPKDSSLGDGQASYRSVSYNIPAVEDEPNSRYKALLQRVDYKLSYVLRTGKDDERRMSWREMAKTLHGRYIDFNSRQLRTAGDLLRQMGLNVDDEPVKKITTIESWIKSNVTLSPGLRDESAEDFEQSVRKRMSTEKGIVRLTAACLQAAGVEYEVGLAGNRFSFAMDDSLEIWDYIDEYLFYFPALKTYLAPAVQGLRYPLIPYSICGTRGVFTRTKKTSDGYSTAGLDIRDIPLPPASASSVTIDAYLELEGRDLTPLVGTTYLMKGYSASSLRQTLLSIPKEKEREVILAITGLSDKPDDLVDYSVKNLALDNITADKPLTVRASIHSPKLIEKAGPKYLVNAGALIGRQMELYEEKKRRLPVELDYPNEQPRTLHIRVPAGYKVVNPQAFRMDASCKAGGKEACGFHSDYRQEGADIIVTAREFYNQVSYPLTQYEAYRKVVNTAADFSKAVLVLQKM